MSYVNVSTTPLRLPLVLNDSIRFDRPGHYRVKVETSRVSVRTGRTEYQPPQTFVTNEVNFDIQLMTEEDEQKEPRLRAVNRPVGAREQQIVEIKPRTGEGTEVKLPQQILPRQQPCAMNGENSHQKPQDVTANPRVSTISLKV